MDVSDGEDMSSGSGSNITTTSSNSHATSSTSSPRDAGAGTGAGIKCCAGCRTTKTPLWRGGPDGPKSLCNACGIRYRKRRREILGIDDDQHPPATATTGAGAAAAATTTTKKRKRATAPKAVPCSFPKQGDRLLSQSLLLWLNNRQRGSRLREEEQAAVLLMALSCGLLYA